MREWEDRRSSSKQKKTLHSCLVYLIGYTGMSVEWAFDRDCPPRDTTKEQDTTNDCPPYFHGRLQGFRIPSLLYPG